MIKMFFNLGVIFCAVALSAPAIAGIRDVGNGGVGIFCEKETDPANRVQLFDLYEGLILKNLKPLDSSLDFENYALSFADHLDQIIDSKMKFKERIIGIFSMFRFMPQGVGLKLTDDVSNFIYPKACKLVQILNFNNGFVYVDRDYWDQLSSTGKAAAILHEAIYTYARERKEDATVNDGDTTSERTRRAVALLMAGKKLKNIYDYDRKASEQLFCTTPFAKYNERPTTEFIITIDSKQATELTFTRVAGVTALSRISLSSPASIRQNSIAGKLNSLIDWDVEVSVASLGDTGVSRIGVSRNDYRTEEDVQCVSIKADSKTKLN